VRRAFAVLGPPARVVPDAVSASPATIGRVAAAPVSARSVVARTPFTLDQVLRPQVLGVFLDRVAERPDAASPGMRALLERARSGQVAGLVVPEAIGKEAAVADFLKGLTLLAEKKFNPAANAFRSAMRASSDFYPAMVYLGACYAAGGNDKEAAGAWNTALIKEGLRQDRGDLALQAIDRARARWPDDEGLRRRYVAAALLAGKYAEGLGAVEELIAEKAHDEPSLALALLVLYEAFVNAKPIETIEQDRARMIRFAEAYRVHGGPSLALVETWVAAATTKR
jgi:tetratricopeptide (TPR) repeat protein